MLLLPKHGSAVGGWEATGRHGGDESGSSGLYRQRWRWQRNANFRGQSYPFAVGGLGIGGIGASTINAQGEVYGLNKVSDFPGAYAQGRYGAVIGNESAGDLWLRNEKGVIMHLKAKRTGLMLSLGGDAVVISMQ
jgi:hypothetical protein